MSLVSPRLLLGMLLLLASGGQAFGHAIGAQARIRGGQVEVEAYFDDDTPAGQARVTVRNRARWTIAEGRTDERGVWAFPAPTPGPYEFRVDAGTGHRTAWIAFTVETAASDGVEREATAPASEGPTREEFTRVPWLRIALGLSGIVLAAVVGRWLLRGRG
jgi:hypothetical protein